MKEPEDGIELLLHLVAEETDMLKCLFTSIASKRIVIDRLTMFCWDKWPENKKEIVRRCIRRGLITMERCPPIEREFSLWAMVQPKSAHLQKGMEELKEEYFQNEYFPVLFLTSEGKQFLQKSTPVK